MEGMEGRRDRGKEGKRERGRGGKEGGSIPTHSDTEELLLDADNEAVSLKGECHWIIRQCEITLGRVKGEE